MFKLWEIVFMGFLTHRNLPEMLGSHIQQIEHFHVLTFLHAQIFYFFQKIWFAITAIRASPGPETLQDSCSIFKKSYIDSTIHILKNIFLRLHGEKHSYEKTMFF